MRKIFIILLCFTLLSGMQPDTVNPETANAKIKTVYMYNFTKYIDWPDNYKTGNFTIAVLGSNQYILSELNNMAEKKKAGNQSFEIKSVSSIDGASKYHMLFVSPEYQSSLNEIVAKLKGKSTLIITEKPGMTKQGSAINFVVQSSKQKFELSKSNAEKYNLKISSSLVQLAIVVE